jgi:membrane protein DedA with SNARE-associated domain
MNLPLFLIYTAIGAGLWSALLTGAGYILGAKFEKVGEYLNPLSYVVVAAILFMYFFRVIREGRRKSSV